MMLKFAASSLVALSLSFSALAFPAPNKVTGDYIGVHDPTICKDDTGKYFLFATGNGIEIRTSADRVDWKLEGVVFDDPTWTDQYTGTSNGLVTFLGDESIQC